MDVDNIWRKGRNQKGKGNSKGHYKGAKVTTKDLTQATKETTTKEDTTKAKEKATQDPKAMDRATATKAKETTAN